MLLFFGLTEIGTQFRVMYCDGGQPLTRGPAGTALIEISSSLSGTFCTQSHPARPAQRAVRTAYVIQGIFPRHGISWSTGFIGGIAIPALLVISTAYWTLKVKKRRLRAVALVFLLPSFFYIATALWEVGIYIQDSADFQVDDLVVLIFALMCAALFGFGSRWLWRLSSQPS